MRATFVPFPFQYDLIPSSLYMRMSAFAIPSYFVLWLCTCFSTLRRSSGDVMVRLSAPANAPALRAFTVFSAASLALTEAATQIPNKKAQRGRQQSGGRR